MKRAISMQDMCVFLFIYFACACCCCSDNGPLARNDSDDSFHKCGTDPTLMRFWQWAASTENLRHSSISHPVLCWHPWPSSMRRRFPRCSSLGWKWGYYSLYIGQSNSAISPLKRFHGHDISSNIYNDTIYLLHFQSYDFEDMISLLVKFSRPDRSIME